MQAVEVEVAITDPAVVDGVETGGPGPDRAGVLGQGVEEEAVEHDGEELGESELLSRSGVDG